MLPELFLAPRGLITILLFYAIPAELKLEEFNPGILLFIIIASSLAMAIALIKDKKGKESQEIELEIEDTTNETEVVNEV